MSTQVGCAIGCKFCASGLDGLKRNLSTGEIVGQVLLARRQAQRRIDNLVFMGMGEPLANLPALLPALDQIISPNGLGIGARHLTLSTSGLALKSLSLPNILPKSGWPSLCMAETMKPGKKSCPSIKSFRWINFLTLVSSLYNNAKR